MTALVQIGWVGLGRMGQAMAMRLLGAGYLLTVYNRTASACEALAAAGARVAAHPVDVATKDGVLVSMLTGEAAITAVCAGPHGILASLRGGTHVSMSTLSPEAATRLAAIHDEAAVVYISARSRGGRPWRRAASWWPGCRDRNSHRWMRCWQCCAARWIRLGPDAATAAAAKLALNLLMNANIALFAEAFAFVEDHGVDTAVFGNGLTETAFAAPLFKAIVAGLPAPQDVAQGSDIALSRKDLALLLGSRTLPLTESVHALFDRADQWTIEQQHNPEGGGAHGIQREDDRPRVQGIRFNCLV